MLIGEMQELFAERMEDLGHGLSQKKYVFQIRNDNGRRHFRRVSRRYPELMFVLTYDGTDGPDSAEFGSYLIRQGRSSAYAVPQDTVDLVMSGYGIDYDSDENEIDWWHEPSWDLEDIAESFWLTRAVRRLRRENLAGGGTDD